MPVLTFVLFLLTLKICLPISLSLESDMETSSSDIHQQILEHLKKVPIFNRLTDSELRKIYGICRFKRYNADEAICRFGTPSADLFVLLDGRLVARSRMGVDIAYISPIGVLTDQPRSADVVAIDDALGFQIAKKDLIDLFIADAAICRKILLNMVKELSNKLYDTNAEIEKLRAEVAEKSEGEQSAPDNIFLY